MKRIKLILGIIIGILIVGVIGVQAATLISSSQVLYKDDTTVEDSLDNLYDELLIGKEKIAEAITNKGVTTTSDSTLEEMATNIDSISSGLVGEKFFYISTATAASNGASLSVFYSDDLYNSGITTATRYHSTGTAHTTYNLVSIGYGTETALYWNIMALTDLKYNDLSTGEEGILLSGETLNWHYATSKKISFVENK